MSNELSVPTSGVSGRLRSARTREQWIDSLNAYKSTTLAANSDVEMWALFIRTSSRLSLQVDSLSFLVCRD